MLYGVVPANARSKGTVACRSYNPKVAERLLTLALILVPYIPGLNELPRYLGVYRLIWREHYRRLRAANTCGDTGRSARSSPVDASS